MKCDEIIRAMNKKDPSKAYHAFYDGFSTFTIKISRCSRFLPTFSRKNRANNLRTSSARIRRNEWFLYRRTSINTAVPQSTWRHWWIKELIVKTKIQFTWQIFAEIHANYGTTVSTTFPPLFPFLLYNSSLYFCFTISACFQGFLTKKNVTSWWRIRQEGVNDATKHALTLIKHAFVACTFTTG